MGGFVGGMFLRTFASIGQYMVPLVCLLGAAMSAWRRSKRRALVTAVKGSSAARALDAMSWREFEMLVGEAFRLRGFRVAVTGDAGPDGGVDLVISNPPYVPDEAVPRDPEVWLHDPAMALYGGVDGLDVVRVLSQRALRLLRPGGLLVIEHGELQAAPIAALLAGDGWRGISHHRDLTARDRATTALR